MVDQKRDRASPPVASESRIITRALSNRPMIPPGQSEMLVSETLAQVMTVFQYQVNRLPILRLIAIIRWLKEVWDSPNQSYDESDYSTEIDNVNLDLR